MTERPARASALRAWAQGSHPLEAAVELLIRPFSGRLLAGAWVVTEPAPGPVWFDVDEVDAHSGVLSGGERRILEVAASLASAHFVVSLEDVLTGLDRDLTDLVLAAFAHAAGSHSHVAFDVDPDAGVLRRGDPLASLHPWPPEHPTLRLLPGPSA